MDADSVDTFSFFERIQRYLRSIGYYGDSPMLTAVYGSSEYAQAFSRVGSLYGNQYIVNTEVDIEKCNFKFNEETNMKEFDSIEYNYNATPVRAKKGILIGSDYQDWVLKEAGLTASASKKMISCVRVMLISKEPLSPDLSERIATFVYPPGTFSDEASGLANKHPIRVFQLDSSIMACPQDLYLIMAIMQLDESDITASKKPFIRFIEQTWPEIKVSESGEITKAAIEATFKPT